MYEWINDIEYHLIPCRSPINGYEKHYFDAYKVWYEAWTKFRNDMGIKEKLHSDGFLLPDEMGVLFYQGKCVGLSSFTHGELKGPIKDQSWWSGWSHEALNELNSISDNLIICSQFSVSPEFTGKHHLVRWKDILSLYALMRFTHSDAGVMAGHLNMSRGMQNACGEETGATVLDPCIPFNFYGVTLDTQLVAYEKQKIRRMQEKKGIIQMCDELWKKLNHQTEFSVIASRSNHLRLVA